MIIKCKLYEADEIINNIETLNDVIVLNLEENSQIVMDKYYILIPELNLKLYNGLFCTFDSNTNEYISDFSVTVIYEADSFGLDYSYLKKDNCLNSLKNIMYNVLPIEKIINLDCEVIIP